METVVFMALMLPFLYAAYAIFRALFSIMDDMVR